MLRLPDDIEEYLLSGQHRRAIQALTTRRRITLDQARDQIGTRVFEMHTESLVRGSGAEKHQSKIQEPPQARAAEKLWRAVRTKWLSVPRFRNRPGTGLTPKDDRFLLYLAGEDHALLVSPFKKRRGALTAVQVTRVEAIVARLRSISTSRSCWIDGRTGGITPALIDVDQLERRLEDYASFTVDLVSDHLACPYRRQMMQRQAPREQNE